MGYDCLSWWHLSIKPESKVYSFGYWEGNRGKSDIFAADCINDSISLLAQEQKRSQQST